MDTATEVMRTTREQLSERLQAAGIRPAPRAVLHESSGEVHISTPDGLYFNLIYTDRTMKPLDIQVIVIGPVRLSPVEIAEKLDDYWVQSVAVLPAEKGGYAAQVIRERGFLSIILRNYQDEPRPNYPTAGRLLTADQPDATSRPSQGNQ